MVLRGENVWATMSRNLLTAQPAGGRKHHLDPSVLYYW
jgi:hypothetical protein